jgi:imidazolonepropionase-like amidohydrolase
MLASISLEPSFLPEALQRTTVLWPGSGLHLELALLHRIGLSPRETIAAATSNFADIYGWRDVGRIGPRRVADVLILDSDPRSDLEALNHIDMMIFQGIVVNRRLLLEARQGK